MKEGKEVKEELQKITLAMVGVSQRLHGYKCPICGAASWLIDPVVRFQMHYDFDEKNEINTQHCGAVPVVAANCRGCGYSIQFNVQMALNFIPDGTGAKISEREVRAKNYKAIYPSEAEIARLKKQASDLEAEIKHSDEVIARLEKEVAEKEAKNKAKN
ncbi:MAG: hypothetical protein NC418_07010 [Muribaculaceae bacterium]|nr:hypothetical protein [Muribaculaceae bacterium]